MDSFFGIGLFELVLIAIIALVVLGPERLPGAMREVAKYMRQLRQISGEFQSQFSEELQMLDEINPKRIIDDAIKPPPKPPAKPAVKSTPLARPPAQGQAAAPPAQGQAAAPSAAPVSGNGQPENAILPPERAPAAADPVQPAPQPGNAGAAPAAEAAE